MKIQTYGLILKRQFTKKWGRFLLASGGIMIGIWAITLTTSLSLGLSGAIVTAINSQPGAKSFTISRTIDNKTDFTQFTEAPKFTGLSKADGESIKNLSTDIDDLQPNTTSGNNFLNLAINYSADKNASCFANKVSNTTLLNNTSISGQTPIAQVNQAEIVAKKEFYKKNCQELTFTNFVFKNVYEDNKKNWLGKTEKPGLNELVTCFKCNEIGKKLGAQNPSDLLNKQVDLEFVTSPINYKPGQEINVTNSTFGVQTLQKSEKISFKIVAVIDDNSSNFGVSPSYVDSFYYDKAIKLGDSTITDENIGYLQFDAYAKSYDKVEGIVNKLKEKNYFPLSIFLYLISGVVTFFYVLTIVLSGFGVIALIASVFGIVNVMTISVLERKKEIGIFKSLGAKDSDIFNIFLIESASLGFIGWLFGTILSLAFGYGIASVFNFVFSTNESWRSNLEGIGITSFGPSYPAWLILGTLAIAILSTSLSGLFPAVKASKQNPVDVLRGD